MVIGQLSSFSVLHLGQSMFYLVVKNPARAAPRALVALPPAVTTAGVTARWRERLL
jgi:hypothetical protein